MWASGLSRPRYNLERVSDVFEQLRSTEVFVGASEPNPNHVPWATLVIGVLILAWLALRLARQDQPSSLESSPCSVVPVPSP